MLFTLYAGLGPCLATTQHYMPGSSFEMIQDGLFGVPSGCGIYHSNSPQKGITFYSQLMLMFLVGLQCSSRPC